MYNTRIYIAIAMLVLVGFMSFAFAARAQDIYQLENPLGGKAENAECLVSLVINFLARDLMPPIAVLMVLWASFLFLTAGGNPGQVVKAREVLLWTVIGAGTLILAPAFMDLILQVFEGNSGNVIKCASAQPIGATVIGTLVNIVNWFSWLLAVLSVAVGLYAGFLYMTAAGEPQKLAVAHKVFMYAIIGIVIGILAFSIIALVRGFVLGGGA